MNSTDHANRLAAAQTVTEALRFDPLHPDTVRLTQAIATLLEDGNPPVTADPRLRRADAVGRGDNQ